MRPKPAHAWVADPLVPDLSAPHRAQHLARSKATCALDGIEHLWMQEEGEKGNRELMTLHKALEPASHTFSSSGK